MILVCFMISLTIVVGIQIVSRLIGTSMNWTEELARYFLIWITFLGAAVAYHDGRHIAVSFLVDCLPRKMAFASRFLSILACLTLVVVLAYWGVMYMNMQYFQRSPAMGLPMSYVYLIIPISFSLIAIYSLKDILHLTFSQSANNDSPSKDGCRKGDGI